MPPGRMGGWSGAGAYVSGSIAYGGLGRRYDDTHLRRPHAEFACRIEFGEERRRRRERVPSGKLFGLPGG